MSEHLKLTSDVERSVGVTMYIAYHYNTDISPHSRTLSQASTLVSLLKRLLCVTDRSVRDSKKELKLERPCYHVLQRIDNVSAARFAFGGKNLMIFVIEECKLYINETNCYSQKFHIKRVPDGLRQLLQVSNCAFCVDSIFTNEFGTRTATRAVA